MANIERLVETNPLVKLKRGTYTAMGNVPNIDGTIYLASLNDNEQIQVANTVTEANAWHLFCVDATGIADGEETVFRYKLDAYRALFAKKAAVASTADGFTSAITLAIADGPNDTDNIGSPATIQRSGNTVKLLLPSTIKANIVGNITGTAEKAKALTSTSIGSTNTPIYINNEGKPTACGGTLSVSVTGNAATATKWITKIPFGTTDGTHESELVEVDGTNSTFIHDAQRIPLPSIITATLNGCADSALKLVAKNQQSQQLEGLNVGVENSLHYAVEFANGVPVVYKGKLQNTTVHAEYADKLGVNTVGGEGKPIYLDSGIPKPITTLDLKDWLGNQIIPIENLPKDVQERLFITTRLNAAEPDTDAIIRFINAKNQDTPDDPVGPGDVVEVVQSSATNGNSNSLYYIYVDSEGRIIPKPFSAGSAATATVATSANQLTSAVTFLISDNGNPKHTSSDGGISTNLSGGTDVEIKLPSTITATLNGTADKALALDVQGAVGSAKLPIYINDAGQPVACNHKDSGATSALDINISGEAASAKRLSGNPKINGTVFNGTDDDVTTAFWGHTTSISIVDNGTGNNKHSGDGTSINGLNDSYELKLPAIIVADLQGTADTAKVANKTEYSLILNYKGLDVNATPKNLVTFNGSSQSTIDGTKKIEATLTPDLFFPKYTLNTISIPTGGLNGGIWTNINNIPTDMTFGTYIIQVVTTFTVLEPDATATNGTRSVTYNDNIYSGIMSFDDTIGNSTDSDEILLHSNGAYRRIYMRIKKQVNDQPLLQYCTSTTVTSGTLDISFRRVL